jgi:transcription initiation factor TFIIH subunit 3
MLYSSTSPVVDDEQKADSNYYSVFKRVDSTVVQRIMEELDDLGDLKEEGMSGSLPLLYISCSIISPLAPCALVGALTKALCCASPVSKLLLV